MKKHLMMLALVSSAPLAVFAADMNNGGFGPAKGDREFTLSGAGTSNKNFDRGSLGATASFGWYATDELEVVIRQSINYADLSGDSNWNGSTRVAADYHWDLGKWRPLVGLQIGGIYGDGVTDTGVAGPEVGIKYYAKPDTFVYLQEEYQFFFKNASDLHNNFDDGAFVHTLGVGFNF